MRSATTRLSWHIFAVEAEDGTNCLRQCKTGMGDTSINENINVWLLGTVALAAVRCGPEVGNRPRCWPQQQAVEWQGLPMPPL